MLKLYDYLESGNGYKVRLLLTQLGRRFEVQWRDILLGETRTEEFLALNPNGRIPVVRLEDGRLLWESNAIAWYLAQGSELLPADSYAQAQVLQWLFFEQYSHEPYIATVRFWTFSGVLDAHEHELEARRAGGYAALGVMERHLAGRSFFVAESYSVADIALYSYTHVAAEGGYDLAGFPLVQAWCERVRAQPGHVLITDAGVGG